MATLDVGGGHSRRRAVDSTIPLIPFIDLLLCCVMFLLVTAVWNELAGRDVVQRVPGLNAVDQPPVERLRIVLQLRQQGYVVATTVGDRVEIPKVGDSFDTAALRTCLGKTAAVPGAPEGEITVTAEDGLVFADIIEAMDAAAAAGFDRPSLLAAGAG